MLIRAAPPRRFVRVKCQPSASAWSLLVISGHLLVISSCHQDNGHSQGSHRSVFLLLTQCLGHGGVRLYPRPPGIQIFVLFFVMINLPLTAANFQPPAGPPAMGFPLRCFVHTGLIYVFLDQWWFLLPVEVLAGHFRRTHHPCGDNRSHAWRMCIWIWLTHPDVMGRSWWISRRNAQAGSFTREHGTGTN